MDTADLFLFKLTDQSSHLGSILRKPMLERSHQNGRKWPAKGYTENQMSSVQVGKFRDLLVWGGPDSFPKHYPSKRIQGP